jgi:hypothetical protein
MVAAAWSKPGIRAGIFKGSQTTQVSGVNATVTWDVLAAPVVSLSQPDAAMWSSSIGPGGKPAAAVGNSFLVKFPKLQVSMSTVGDSVIAANALCSVTQESGGPRMNALAVTTDLSQAGKMDQFIYKAVIIPQVLKMAGAMLSAHTLPSINVPHAQFGPGVIAIGNGRFVLAATLAGGPVPAISAAEFPGVPFCVLLSPGVVQLVGNAEAARLAGKVLGSSGSQSFGIGKANYSGSITLNRVNAAPANLPELRLQIALSASASAGVDLLGPIGGIATTVAGGVTTAANTVAGGVTTAANAVAKAFSSY